MRPISLKLSAFGPYAGKAEIPMEELGTQGLYLITGDTGAGKTTIFDAICFALFGEASGPNREVNMFRSKYADEDTPTEVELRFTHAGKEYFVRRNPEYLRPAKKGDGYTRQVADAELHMPNGKIITKVKDVTREIEDLLGVNKEQFSQIAMLAQGDFLKLLLADTKSRMEIFRELFKTRNYERLQKRLDEEQRAIYGLVEDAKKSVNQYIAGIQVDRDDTLSIDVEEAQKGRMTPEDVVDLLDKLTGKDNALKDSINKDLSSVNKKLETVNAEIGAAEALEKSRKNLESAKASLEEEEPKVASLKADFDKAKEELKEKSKIEKESAKIEKEFENYDAVDSLTHDIEKTKQEKTKTETKVIEQTKALEEERIELDKLKKEHDSIKDSGAEEAKLVAKLEKIEAEAQDLNSLSGKLKSVFNDRDKLKDAQDDYKKKDAAFNELNSAYEQMEQAFRDGQAGVLAEKLKEGEKCPVCGSTSHPKLAKKSDKVPSEKELDDAKNKADKARSAREKSASEASGLKKALEAKEEDAIKLSKKLLKEEDIDAAWNKINSVIKDCESKQEEVNKDLEKVREKAERKKKLEKLIPESEAEIAEEAKAVETLKEKAAGFVSAVAEKEKSLNNMKKSLSFASRREAEVEKRILDKRAYDLQTAYDKADKSLKKQNEIIVGLKSQIESLTKAISAEKAVDLDGLREQQNELNQKQRDCIKDGKTVESRIRINEEIRTNIIRKTSDIAEISKKLQWMRALSDTANGKLTGKEKIMLETYIQMTYFDRIIDRANLRLMTMSSGQYELIRMKEAANAKSQSGLDLGVIDHYNGSERSVKTLSGGESFMASLSLALGLSDEVQSSAGGIQVDTLFVDEGFGSLDSETLEQAYRALAGLTEGNRLVGIISHVADLKERIDKQIVVTKAKSGGSSVKIIV